MPVFLAVILSIFDIWQVSEMPPETIPNGNHAVLIEQKESTRGAQTLAATNLSFIKVAPEILLRRCPDPAAPFPSRPGVDTVSLLQLELRTLRRENDTLYIVNFWATWCKPCVQELPFFEEAGMKFAESPVKILLVSLDMHSDMDKVDSFAAKHLGRNEVYVLRAGNPDVWINAIDPQWSGAIPATAFYRNGKKLRFHEGDLTQPELFDLIHSFL